MISLRDYQKTPVLVLSKTKRGICKAPAGSGKTIIAAAAIDSVLENRDPTKPKPKILWIANTIDQLDQGEEACRLFPRIRLDAQVDFRHPVSLSPVEVSEKNYNLIVVDECHHAAAREWANVIAACNGARWGLSATPEREDDLADKVFELIGPIVAEVKREAVMDARKLAPGRVVWHELGGKDRYAADVTSKTAEELPKALTKLPTFRRVKWAHENWQKQVEHARIFGDNNAVAKAKEMLDLARESEKKTEMQVAYRFAKKALADDSRVSKKVIQLVSDCEGSSLTLLPTVEQCQNLAEKVPNSVALFSRMGAKKRKEAMVKLRSGETRHAFATSLADEGLDIPRLSMLVMVSPSRSSRLAIQRTGRVLRSFEGKTEGVIHDFLGEAHYFFRNQARKRRAIYKALGYQQENYQSNLKGQP